MAGLGTPRNRRRRNTAAVVTAPVFPALTIASASPSRTARAQRTIEESLNLRTARTGSSSMAMTSRASRTVTPGGAGTGRCGVISSARPTSATPMPISVAAWIAPVTISPGPRSPPMASTATVQAGPGTVLVDLDALHALVVAAVAADPVGQLHRAAVGTQRPGGCLDAAVRRPAGVGPRSWGFALGDSHQVSSERSDLEFGEDRPAGIHGRVVGVGGVVDRGRVARRVAMRGEGQLEEHGVSDQLVEVDLVAFE